MKGGYLSKKEEGKGIEFKEFFSLSRRRVGLACLPLQSSGKE